MYHHIETIGDFPEKTDPKTKAPTGKRFAGRSFSKGWWTRNERIRTEAEIPFKVALLEDESPPLYQTIAEKAHKLHQSGMNAHNIAKQLNIDDKTAAKALRWWNANKST